jgi:uncharacterized protein YcfL
MPKLVTRSVCMLAALLIVACSSTSTDVLPPTVNVSIGQQLIDLKNAKDKGTISQAEYEKQSKQLIDSVK